MCVCVCVCVCARGTRQLRRRTVLPIAQLFQAQTQLPLAWCIDHWCIDCWAQIFAASGPHIATRPQSPHTYATQSTLTSDSTVYTLTRGQAPSRKYNCTMGKLGNNYITETELQLYLYNSISHATDYCTDSVHLYTLVYTVLRTCWALSSLSWIHTKAVN